MQKLNQIRVVRVVVVPPIAVGPLLDDAQVGLISGRHEGVHHSPEIIHSY